MTFSIAGVCPRTGAIGQALTTSSMAAGARAMFIAPGKGAIFAQARSDPRLGAIGIAALSAGKSAAETLGAMLAAAAPHEGWRQLAVLDASGTAAHATGVRTNPCKGAAIGSGAIAIGNGLATDEVVPATLRAFEATLDLPLAERLIAALEAGLAAGGEPWPLRSAALRIARPDIPFPTVDLRVDLDDAPLARMRHLWVNFAPLEPGYLARTMDPDNAPQAAEMEKHIH